MRREVNIEAARHFCRKIFPLVKEKVPDAVFVIAGVAPPPDIVQMGDGTNVIVTGYVESMTEIYRNCRIFVAPLLLGGGIIVKILDAMAAGRPVVTTRIGNEGILAEDGKEVFVAHSEKEFADRVILLLEDDDIWKDMARRARAFCTTRFRWEQMVNRLSQSFSDLVAANKA
jgi:glycosyltransferase involved in cell wall biosynthesis